MNTIRLLLRIFYRQPYFRIWNLLGMTLGLTAFFLINVYTYYQVSFNRNHDNYEKLYRMTTKISNAGNETHFAISPKIGAPQITEFFSEIRSFCRTNREPGTIRIDDRRFEGQAILAVDSTFSTTFNVDVLAGDLYEALKDPNSVAITDSAAIRFFNDTNVVSQFINIETGRLSKRLKIGAVLRQPPANTNIQYDAVVNFENIEATFGPSHGHVGAINSFLLINPQDLKGIEDRLPEFYEAQLDGLNGIISYAFQPFKHMYFNNTLTYDLGARGNRTNVHILIGLSIFLLTLAGLNFMNLSTAAAVSRHKEMSIRKVLGDSKGNIILESYFETFLTILVALVVSIVISGLLLPWLDDFVGLPLSSITISSLSLAPFLLLLLVVLSLFAGTYMAFYLSKHASIVHRQHQFNKGLRVKKVLMALQFLITSMALSSVFLVKDQLNFLKTKDLGYNSEQVVSMVVNIPGIDLSTKKTLQKEVQGLAGVSHTTLTLSQLSFEMPRLPFVMEKDSAQNFQVLNYHEVDGGFLNTFEMTMLYGRTFETSDSARFIVNESAARKLGFSVPESIVGQLINMGRQEAIIGHVIGVVSDFHFESLHFPIQPLILSMTNLERRNFLSVRLSANPSTAIIDNIAQVWNTVLPDAEFDYRFLSEINENQYRNEERLSDLLDYSTLIVAIISAMGIMGLTRFISQDKVREVGIRKTLGASVSQVSWQFCKPLTYIVLIGNLISIPIVWQFGQSWLHNFPFATNVSPAFFGASLLISLGLSAIAIGHIIWRAAHADIISSLRQE